MTYEDLLELKNQRAVKLAEGGALLEKKDFDGHKALMDGEIADLNRQIDAVEKQLAEEGRFGGQGTQPDGMTPGAVGKGGKEDPYANAVKAFAKAARAGFRVDKAAGDQMQEGVDADGGYTVPEDIVTRIMRFRESKESLLDLVTVVPVKTHKGSRTIKKRCQHQGFATVAEAAAYGKAATPQFDRLEYNIEKRGGVLPVTDELLNDSDENIAAVVEEWLGDEARVTANREILDVIGGKDEVDLVDLDGIIGAWIRLGSAFRATSKLITNDDGLALLGTLKDANGRYLLSPNPSDTAQLRLCVGPYILPVKTFDNDTLPSDDTKIPMILGDLKEGVVYWDRQLFTVRRSDVAVVGDLNAFEQDLTLWKGSLRDDCTKRDEAAVINGYIDTAVPELPPEGGGTGGSGDPDLNPGG